MDSRIFFFLLWSLQVLTGKGLQLHIEKFNTWLHKNKAIFDKCRIDSDSYGGYRLVAKEVISCGESILEIPLSCCFSSHLHPITKENEWMEELEWPARIAAQLLIEKQKGDDSFWAPYISLLPSPRRFTSSLPYYWPEDTIDDLACFPEISDEVNKMKFMRQNLFEKTLQKSPFELERKDFDWALDCVATRNIKIDSTTNMCVPLLDFMNHNASVRSKFELILNKDSKESFVRVIHLPGGRDLLPGDEIFLNYGELDVVKSLCDYGFISSDAALKEASISLSIPRKYYVKHLMAELQAKEEAIRSPLALLRRLNIDYTGSFGGNADGVEPSLLTALAILKATPDELKLYCGSFDKSEDVYFPVMAAMAHKVLQEMLLEELDELKIALDSRITEIEDEMEVKEVTLGRLYSVRSGGLEECYVWSRNMVLQLSE